MRRRHPLPIPASTEARPHPRYEYLGRPLLTPRNGMCNNRAEHLLAPSPNSRPIRNSGYSAPRYRPCWSTFTATFTPTRSRRRIGLPEVCRTAKATPREAFWGDRHLTSPDVGTPGGLIGGPHATASAGIASGGQRANGDAGTFGQGRHRRFDHNRSQHAIGSAMAKHGEDVDSVGAVLTLYCPSASAALTLVSMRV